MGYIDDLKSGRPGIKLAIPESWQVHEDQARRAVLVDNEHGVGWHIVHAPFLLDMRPEYDAQLKQDLERHVRHAFAEQYAQLQLPPELASQRAPVRTADPSWPGWSPLIEIDRVQIGGVPALVVIRRLVYEAVMEVVLGSVLIPLNTGLCEITAFHRAGGADVGQREGMLINLALQQRPGQRPPELARQLGQAHFDDPVHDAKFPKHALTLVRAALRWVLADGRLEVSSPAPVPQSGEIELLAATSTLVPPPRYLPVPRGNLPAPPTMSVLSRVTLEAMDNPRLLDVWLLPDALITGQGDERMEQLVALAKKSSADWERQGATDVRLEVTKLPPEGGQVRVAATLRMMLGGAVTQSVSRWIADDDGVVFRIALGAPIYVPVEELSQDADFALRTWRRLKPQRTAWLTSDQRLRPAAS